MPTSLYIWWKWALRERALIKFKSIWAKDFIYAGVHPRIAHLNYGVLSLVILPINVSALKLGNSYTVK